MTEAIAVQMDQVTFTYSPKDSDALMYFDGSFKSGATTAIMGPSGSGKSTLVALIAGFEKALDGKIVLEGRDFTLSPPAQRPLSMVFQENNLFAHMSVTKNVGLGIKPDLRLNAEDLASIDEALSDVGLAQYGERLPAQLSGGERQRVALARVLVRRKPILILDEAFASLGPGLRDEMLDLVGELTSAHSMSTLMVTHAPEDALRIAENLVFLDNGRIVLTGGASDLLTGNGDNPLIRSYLGAAIPPKK